MSENKHKIIIAAGGTGGHVFPAITIANEIKKICPETEFLFIGTKGKIEEKIVPQSGYKLSTIWISGFHRNFKFENLVFPIKVIVSLIQSFFLIKKFKPNVVVGTGGYVCGPVLYIASLLRKPTVIHESNSYPGITTRILSTLATKVLISFDITTQYLKNKGNVELVGTPTREELLNATREEGIKFFNLDYSKKTVLVFGGSLGALSINNAIKEIINDLVNLDIQIIWQVGKSGSDLVNEFSNLKNCRILTFIEKMEYAYASADVVVCRAGAITIAELTLLGKPAILVPYPYAAEDHQTYNSKAVVDAGGAIMIADKDLKSRLKDELLNILKNEQKLKQMSESSKKIGKPNANKEIANKILSMIK